MKKSLSGLLLSCLLSCTLFAQTERILFDAVPENEEIRTVYSIAPDGTDLIRLFPDDGKSRSGVAVSKNGMFLAYIIVDGNSHHIATSYIDGSNEQVVYTTPTSRRLLGGFDWSPDDEKLLFVEATTSSTRDSDIYELTLSDKSVVNLTNNWNNEEFHPKYSTDGSKIAYTYIVTGWFRWPWDLWIMDRDGTNKTRLTTDAGFNDGDRFRGWDCDCIVRGFDFKPNESEIYYARGKSGGFWKMNLDGSEQEQIPISGNVLDFRFADFSPNGLQLAGYRMSIRDEIFITTIDGVSTDQIHIPNVESILGITWTTTTSPDNDNDGVTAHEDCNDEDPNIGLPQTWYADTDGDGFGDEASAQVACEQPEGFVANSTDCNDSNPEINPHTVWYQDSDSDTFGNGEVSITGCEKPEGYVGNATDCHDADASVYPGAPEISGDGRVNDCGPLVAVSCESVTAITAIIDFEAEATTSNTIRLFWTSGENPLATFTIERSIYSDFSDAVVQFENITASSEEYLDETVIAGQQYFYRIKIVGAD